MKPFFVLVGKEKGIAIVSTAEYVRGYRVGDIDNEIWEVVVFNKKYKFSCIKSKRETNVIGDKENFASFEIECDEYFVWKR